MENFSQNDAEVKVLKIGVCPSLSGRSSLTYHIGCRSDVLGKEGSEFNDGISFRIHENSGSGLFSNQWVPVISLKAIFDKEKSKDAVTSSTLKDVFAGSSVNTAGFILAVMKAEGLVVHKEEMRRYYQCASSEQFFIEMKRLCVAINAGETGMAMANAEDSGMAIVNAEEPAVRPMPITKPKKR